MQPLANHSCRMLDGWYHAHGLASDRRPWYRRSARHGMHDTLLLAASKPMNLDWLAALPGAVTRAGYAILPSIANQGGRTLSSSSLSFVSAR